MGKRYNIEVGDDMLLKHVQVKNFRSFEQVELDLSPSAFTVIIGENGRGKTALLEAMSIGISSLLLGFNNVPVRNISVDDIQFKLFEKGSTANIEKQFPVEIKCTGYLNDDYPNVTWERTLKSENGKTTRIGAKDIIDYGKALQVDVMNGRDTTLPLVAYYGTQRLWNTEVRMRRSDVSKLTSRTHAYLDALEPFLNMKLLHQWFFDKKITEFEDGYTPGEFKALQMAIRKCMEHVQTMNSGQHEWNLEYSGKFKELQFSFPDGTRLPFRHLSDGYRNVVGLVADIAFRMASLNPHLGEQAIMETPGIILIDEIDLHLHPKWQRHIVSDLKRTFPKIQFIVTTHSPFIIQSLHEGELRVISKDGKTIHDDVVVDGEELVVAEYADQSIEDVVENVMGIHLPQWSKRKAEMYAAAEKYFSVLNEYEQAQDTKHIEQLKERLDEEGNASENTRGQI